MELLIPILIVSFLIVINGIFVGAEFAILAAPRGAIERRAEAGERAARRVRRSLADPRRQDRYMATAQIGITLASLGLGMYAEHGLAQWLAAWFESLGEWRWLPAHGVASVVALVVLTYLHIVVGEMVPKSLALSHAERAALGLSGLMLVFRRILFPLVVTLNGVGNLVLGFLGVRRETSSARYATQEELEMIIDESEEGGLLHPESGRVLRELFDFGELTAGQVAVPRVRIVALRLGASPATLAAAVREARHTHYPVYDRDLDRISGFVHVKDILRLLLANAPLDAGVVRPVPFVPETSPLEHVVAAMHEARSQMAVVMDEHGGTAGLITIEDVSAEILGQTVEADGRTLEWSRDAKGRVRAAGTLRLEELGEILGVDLGHEEVESVSGLLLHLQGRPPARGDTVTWRGLRFRVTRVVGRGVRECVVEPVQPPREDSTPAAPTEG